MNIRIYVEEIQKKLEVFLKILTFEKNTVNIQNITHKALGFDILKGKLKGL